MGRNKNKLQKYGLFFIILHYSLSYPYTRPTSDKWDSKEEKLS